MKTQLSIEVAKALGSEIINVDFVQVYKCSGMGAAKISLEEQQGVPHHLMDMMLPTMEYTYKQILADVFVATEAILSKGLWPIVINGTWMCMHWDMQNMQDITSHLLGKNTKGLMDHLTQ